MNHGFDIGGWNNKMERFRKNLAVRLDRPVKELVDSVRRQINANLSGREYRRGELPVRVVTGFLRNSIKTRKLAPLFFEIRQDSTVARYGIFVHNRKDAPRPFFGQAFDKNEVDKKMVVFEREFHEELRKLDAGIV